MSTPGFDALASLLDRSDVKTAGVVVDDVCVVLVVVGGAGAGDGRGGLVCVLSLPTYFDTQNCWLGTVALTCRDSDSPL